jgi:Cd2+/Zn2+-exporting ATPase
MSDNHENGHDHSECEAAFNPKKELTRLIISLILMLVGMYYREELQATPYQIGDYAVFLIAYLLIGWKILQVAAKNLFKGDPFDENFLMAIATLGAIAIQELPEAVAVILFFRVGEFFQQVAVNNSRSSIKSLVALRPDYAHLKRDENVEKVNPEDVQVGDFILVKPGEKVPLDGEISEGSSQMDTSALTGESVPRGVKVGDSILSGMLNKGGLLTVKVTKTFGESSMSKILDLVENASSKKAETEKFITRLAKVYTPIVVLLAVLVAAVPPFTFSSEPFSDWLYRALILLVISCPCGLVISIPLGFFGGIGGAAKRGILIKGATFLDTLTQIKYVLFDKTGTLTKGTFKVTKCVTRNGFKVADLLENAAKAEVHSHHPIADSIRTAYAKEVKASDVQDFKEIPGHGIRTKIGENEVMVGNDRLLHKENIEHDTCDVQGTVAHVVINRKYAGYIVIADEIKEDSTEAIRELKSLGVHTTMMLTGDSKDVAERVAKEVGIDSFAAELLPEGKVAEVEKLIAGKNPNEKVIFVGDGVNDAPVLALADVGIAMGGLGSDAAIETADVVIMGDMPSKVAEAIQVGRKTRAIVWQNITFAMGVKIGVIILGAIGMASMWQAIFADVGVAILAVFNASRALYK